MTSHSVCPGSGGFAGLCSCLRDARREALDPDLRVGVAARLQRLGHRLHHAVRTADEHGVDGVEIEPVREQRVGLRPVDPAVQELDVLRLARQHVDQVEARQVGVLQRRELLLEHHGARRAVAVEQRELARGSAASVVLTIESSGVMPLPAAKPDVVPAVAGGERHVEVPQRRHHVERVAGLQRLVRPRREHAARIALDRDAQRPVLHAGADRIRPAHVLAVDVGAQRQVLAGGEAERLGQRRRARRT